ncbi:MAG TPA: bifunctional glutamate N-acetyltransferase/amino-acid acetyltransferase ArgJ [Bacteroidota bacterium]|nr:bifunctional glutamate N-acetyltransferase/amino-acid acetyltransferase ArgJ [Bacteroidota bacterium]
MNNVSELAPKNALTGRPASAGVKTIPGGITAPKGFRAAGIHCGVKKLKKDICLVVSDAPAACAVVLTTNRVQAAPVLLTREKMERSRLCRALVVNSGNANACTGDRGMKDARAMAEAAASALNVPVDEVLVSSTGVIGQFLPIEAVTAGIAGASRVLSPRGGASAAEAIMTTDTFVKEFALEFECNGVLARMGGMAKGSGMIAPNMATMLAFVSTDAAVEPEVLRTALARAADCSFNRISVDGDTSTNDMVALLANGASGAPPLATASGPSYEAFFGALERTLVALSKMIVRDGEGATKFVEITVTGAADESSAVKAARAIANSNLVKTAIHGEDANWGRILAAVGYSGIEFDPAQVEIFFGDVAILRRNYAIDFSEAEAKEVLSHDEITITVDLHAGEAKASFWTCDLSAEYVHINASYRT